MQVSANLYCPLQKKNDAVTLLDKYTTLQFGEWKIVMALCNHFHVTKWSLFFFFRQSDESTCSIIFFLIKFPRLHINSIFQDNKMWPKERSKQIISPEN
jgi:hypothetical protein